MCYKMTYLAILISFYSYRSMVVKFGIQYTMATKCKHYFPPHPSYVPTLQNLRYTDILKVIHLLFSSQNCMTVKSGSKKQLWLSEYCL